MAQCRSNTKIKDSLRTRGALSGAKDDSGCDTSLEEPSTDSHQHDSDGDDSSPQTRSKPRPTSTIGLRSKSRTDSQFIPDVGSTGSSPTTHSNMKTKQSKDELDKSIDEETTIEPKTRQARKKASDLGEEDKNRTSQDEPRASKETKKNLKPKTVVKKRPLGIRKALRSKKVVATAKGKLKNVIKQTVTRGRKPAAKTARDNSQDKDTVPLIPASEIKKEPVDDTTPNSRSSSPKTAGRKQRLTSDKIMMKSVLGDSPSSLVLGPRTSPYSMRSERSNSPSMVETKNLRSGKPRKVKNLLNEVVMKEQNKRRRLLSDSKSSDIAEGTEECKKVKRGRSCSRDGSEISKCSDITESDVSLSETLHETDGKELKKIIEKPKTDLGLDFENNVQISIIEKVPSLVDPKLTEKLNTEPSCNINENSKKSLSLKRSTSLDSDNNNSNRLKLENLNSSDAEDKKSRKTEKDTLFEARSSILTSMSKTFNSKEVSKNIRKARRGRKVAAAARPSPGMAAPATEPARRASAVAAAEPARRASAVSAIAIAGDPADDKHETLETLSKEIDDLINNLDQNIDRDHELANESTVDNTDQMQTKSVSKFYGSSKPLGDNNSIITPETPVKDKEAVTTVTAENTPSKIDDSENIRLHYEEDSLEKAVDNAKPEISYKVSTVASIDKLMDRLKVFEEFDKKRQRQESETKSMDNKTVMVTNDVVLIPKSGADIKPLKDVQSVRSPERPFEKENVLSCFENNSAISIVKRDHVRKSMDIDLPNSVTLIKRNSFSSRKESTSSNHSKESDAISIFEKSLGKDVTLTEIRKSVDKSATAAQVDLHQFATLHPNNPTASIKGVVLDTSQISITPRVVTDSKEIRKSRESLSRKSSESGVEAEEKMATIEKIKSPPPQIKSPPPQIKSPPPQIKSPPPRIKSPPPLIKSPPPQIKSPPLQIPVSPSVLTQPDVVALAVAAPAPVSIMSPEVAPMETETVVPPETVAPPETIAPNETVEIAKAIPEDISLSTEIPKVDSAILHEAKVEDTVVPIEKTEVVPEAMAVATVEKIEEKAPEKPEEKETKELEGKTETPVESKLSETAELAKPGKSPGKGNKSARNSTESQPGPSNVLHETPESQKRKENVLRTLGLLTHKAAKEAKIEKMKEKQRIYGANMSSMMNKKSSKSSGDYTGTLKTVIKLNRGTGDREKKKYRSSLKMTFAKSKHRSAKPVPELGDPADDDAYYTIERREGFAAAGTDGGHRKSYSNRLNNHEAEATPEPVESKETLNLVIPEKASSFSIHPGRLCQDQCFYCGGKFGLFDTPCHIAQMKSHERQKKVLDNEERLTIDSCLCDACYRHVDRRANCPSYRKRAPKPHQPPTAPQHTQASKPALPPLEGGGGGGGEGGGGGGGEGEDSSGSPPARAARCHAAACAAPAAHSIRRKWLIKMRACVNKVLKLESDYPGLHTLGLCGAHYAALAPLLACALCRRRLGKHHAALRPHHSHEQLNPLLAAAGVPAQLHHQSVLCKMCRYYTTLLQQPGHNDKHASSYRRRLLQVYNIEVPPESENDAEDSTQQSAEESARRKKARTKPKRKSSDPDKTGESESSERTESPEKDKIDSVQQKPSHPLEEDIESLISSNKILVPSAKTSTEPSLQSDGSDPDPMDLDGPIIDKQTELQILLQKQNNPAQFMHNQVNLTQKQRNLLKVHNLGIQKPGLQQRINDKNARRLHKLGQMIVQKDKMAKKDDLEIFDPEKTKDITMANLSINEECTIESVPNKKPADINTLKNKWQQSESFTQVKKNLSELSKKLTVDKEPKKADGKYSNPVRRLETNPSISVRELFPGEEEMNLQCNIEFGNVKGATPEGWEKCNSTIQYDVETKKLWNELQRPYGNQSSFLRHLILLEKYFRSGDLVLSHTATPNAAMYSDSVQSRLRAYDNVVNDTPRRSEPAISLIEFRKKPTVNGKSLLKSNQNTEAEKDPKKFMPPPPAFPKPKAKEKKNKQLPPELIAINTPNAQGRKAIQNVLHNIQQLVKGVSASDPTEVAASPLPAPPVKFDPPKEKKEAKPDTPKKQKTMSKPWRPTLMPITPENLARVAREPVQVAVDGRSLPSLVKVMSSGKKYHITLQDYNKMCVMRREKLQQLGHDDPKPKRPSTDTETLVTEVQTSAMLGNGGTVLQNVPTDKDTDKKHLELAQIGSNAATILKNVGLKNITIAPITPKTATVTSQTFPSPVVSSPSLLVTTPIKLPQLGPAVSITSEMTTNLPIMAASPMIMPKIPKSLTVIPQTMVPPTAPAGLLQGADGARP